MAQFETAHQGSGCRHTSMICLDYAKVRMMVGAFHEQGAGGMGWKLRWREVFAEHEKGQLSAEIALPISDHPS